MIPRLSWEHNFPNLLAKRCLCRQPELEADIIPVTEHLVALL